MKIKILFLSLALWFVFFDGSIFGHFQPSGSHEMIIRLLDHGIDG